MAGYASRFIVIADFRYNVECSELSTGEVNQTPTSSPFYGGGNREREGLSDLLRLMTRTEGSVLEDFVLLSC